MVQRMEISNQNLAIQVIATLNTLNENINNLGRLLKTTGIGGEKIERVNDESKLTEGEMNETRPSGTF